MTSYNIGLVLSGGGVRGMAHIGAIKALEEHGIFPDIVSGSSAGAVVGALYCHGYSPDEMMEFFRLTPLFHINRFAFGKPGFIDTDKLYSDFEKYFKHNDFSGLNKKLYVTAVDMLNGRIKVFESGKLIRPLLASSAFPGLFSPVSIENILYSDGGILDNFPISPLKDSCKKVIGVYASPLSNIEQDSLKYSVNVLERAIRINYSKRSHEKFKNCDLLIKPMELAKFGLLEFSKMDDIFQIGYRCAKKEIDKMRSIIDLQLKTNPPGQSP